jgi:hypothetical protein
MIMGNLDTMGDYKKAAEANQGYVNRLQADLEEAREEITKNEIDINDVLIKDPRFMGYLKTEHSELFGQLLDTQNEGDEIGAFARVELRKLVEVQAAWQSDFNNIELVSLTREGDKIKEELAELGAKGLSTEIRKNSLFARLPVHVNGQKQTIDLIVSSEGKRTLRLGRSLVPDVDLEDFVMVQALFQKMAAQKDRFIPVKGVEDAPFHIASGGTLFFRAVEEGDISMNGDNYIIHTDPNRLADALNKLYTSSKSSESPAALAALERREATRNIEASEVAEPSEESERGERTTMPPPPPPPSSPSTGPHPPAYDEDVADAALRRTNLEDTEASSEQKEKFKKELAAVKLGSYQVIESHGGLKATVDIPGSSEKATLFLTYKGHIYMDFGGERINYEAEKAEGASEDLEMLILAFKAIDEDPDKYSTHYDDPFYYNGADLKFRTDNPILLGLTNSEHSMRFANTWMTAKGGDLEKAANSAYNIIHGERSDAMTTMPPPPPPPPPSPRTSSQPPSYDEDAADQVDENPEIDVEAQVDSLVTTYCSMFSGAGDDYNRPSLVDQMSTFQDEHPDKFKKIQTFLETDGWDTPAEGESTEVLMNRIKTAFAPFVEYMEANTAAVTTPSTTPSVSSAATSTPTASSSSPSTSPATLSSPPEATFASESAEGTEFDAKKYTNILADGHSFRFARADGEAMSQDEKDLKIQELIGKPSSENKTIVLRSSRKKYEGMNFRWRDISDGENAPGSWFAVTGNPHAENPTFTEQRMFINEGNIISGHGGVLPGVDGANRSVAIPWSAGPAEAPSPAPLSKTPQPTYGWATGETTEPEAIDWSTAAFDEATESMNESKAIVQQQIDELKGPLRKVNRWAKNMYIYVNNKPLLKRRVSKYEEKALALGLKLQQFPENEEATQMLSDLRSNSPRVYTPMIQQGIPLDERYAQARLDVLGFAEKEVIADSTEVGTDDGNEVGVWGGSGRSDDTT